MCSLKITAITVAATIGFATTAIAADMPVIEHPPAVVPVEIGSGWYLRGDIGYSHLSDPDMKYRWYNFSNTKGNGAFLIGGGFGYAWNEWFRTDLTIDWRGRWALKGLLPCGPCGGYSYESVRLSAWTFLANAYFDFGNWNGFKPYIGAGVGAAYLTAGKHIGINPGFPNNYFNSQGKWNFAGALMAGASYDINENWKIDGSYRYLWLGDTYSGLDPTGNLFGRVEYNNLAAHEFRIGLRYLIY